MIPGAVRSAIQQEGDASTSGQRTAHITRIESSITLPYGLKYATTSLFDANSVRIQGFDNYHGVDVTSGPASKTHIEGVY